MSNLVESILSEDYVSASSIFEARLNEIAEKKLVEMKKCIQAEAAGGGMSKAEFDARRRLGWRPAKEVLPDPRDYVMKIEPKSEPKKPAIKKRKKLKEDHEADIQAAMAKLEKDKHPGLKAARQYTPADIARRKHAPPVSQAPEKKPEEPSVAVRKLKTLPKKRTIDDYRKSLATAKDLAARGHSGDPVGKVKSAYAGVRAKHKAKGFVKDYGSAMGDVAKNIISGLKEDTE